MPELAGEQSLAELVTAVPGATRVFEAHGLDYCCGGRRRLDQACATQGVDPAAVLGELASLDAGPEPDWAAMTPAELVDHLEQTHHAYLKTELPRLHALAIKVTGVHGTRHPELTDVCAAVGDLQADLEPHLRKEEQALFPMVRELQAATTTPSFPCGSLANPISVLLTEHDRAGELLARLRALTGGHRVPEGGCASYHALYAGLAEIEADTHLHVHKENNLLFPAVLALEAAISRRPGPIGRDAGSRSQAR